MSATPHNSERKLILAGGVSVVLLSLVWYIAVRLTGDVKNSATLAAIIGQAIDAVQTVVLGYLGANVLDKAKGVIEALRSKKEEPV
jgi:uncharacterized membrane protein